MYFFFIGSCRVYFNVHTYAMRVNEQVKKQYRDHVFNENTYKIVITCKLGCIFYNVGSASVVNIVVVVTVDVEVPSATPDLLADSLSNPLSDSVSDSLSDLESDSESESESELELKMLESELLLYSGTDDSSLESSDELTVTEESRLLS